MTETPLVELTSVVEAGCEDAFCTDRFFPDGHARPRAYRLMAEAIARELALLRGGEAEELSRSR